MKTIPVGPEPQPIFTLFVDENCFQLEEMDQNQNWNQNLPAGAALEAVDHRDLRLEPMMKCFNGFLVKRGALTDSDGDFCLF